MCLNDSCLFWQSDTATVCIGCTITVAKYLLTAKLLLFARLLVLWEHQRIRCKMFHVKHFIYTFHWCYSSARSAHLLHRPCENIVPVGIQPIAKRFSMAGCRLQFRSVTHWLNNYGTHLSKIILHEKEHSQILHSLSGCRTTVCV